MAAAFRRYLFTERAAEVFGFGAGMAWTILHDSHPSIKIQFGSPPINSSGQDNAPDAEEPSRFKVSIKPPEKDNDSDPTHPINQSEKSSKLSIIENPLSTLLFGAVSGFIVSIGSTFVSGIMPFRLKPLVPICLTLSVVNSAYELYRK
jgi:hypothetical protein